MGNLKMKNPWNEINLPQKDVTARRIDPEHELDLYWALDLLGHYLFIFEFSPEENLPPVTLPDLVGIKTFYVQSGNHIAKNRLILLLNDKNNWEIFLSLCNDLLQATRKTQNSSNAVSVILNRLEHWRKFLQINQSGLLTEEKILGLLGELWFLNKYLIPVFGAGQSITFWQGPEGLPYDFNVNESAIEVKCKSGANTPYVRISSADQLCPQLPEMYFFVVTLGKTPKNNADKINLPQLISQIGDALKSEPSAHSQRFYDLLHAIGYIDSDQYLDFSYIVTNEIMFEVIDGFPRVCSKDLHHGISNLTYSISLLDCAPFEKWPDWMQGIK